MHDLQTFNNRAQSYMESYIRKILKLSNDADLWYDDPQWNHDHVEVVYNNVPYKLSYNVIDMEAEEFYKWLEEVQPAEA